MWMVQRVWFIDPFLYIQWKLLSHTHISVYPLLLGTWESWVSEALQTVQVICIVVFSYIVQRFIFPPTSQSPVFQKLSGIIILVEKSSWLMISLPFWSFLPPFLPFFLLFLFSSALLLSSLFLLLLYLLLFIYSSLVAHWQVLGSKKK